VEIKLVSVAKKHSMAAKLRKSPTYTSFIFILEETGIYFRADSPGKEETYLPSEWGNEFLRSSMEMVVKKKSNLSSNLNSVAQTFKRHCANLAISTPLLKTLLRSSCL